MTPLRSTLAEIDLDAVAHNVSVLRPAGSELIAVVKDDAYGHGAEGVGSAALEAGAAMLAVFTVEEAVVLRRAGIGGPVLVMGGISDPSEVEAALSGEVAVTVWTVEQAKALSRAATAAGRGAAVHLKVDAGLARFGVAPERAAERYARIAELPGVSVEGVFTHLPNADVPGDASTEQQLRRFAEVVTSLPSRPRWVHAQNSAALIALGLADACTAVRPGIALYGLDPASHLSAALRPVLRWTSRIQRLLAAPAGTGVSYGHEYRLARDGLIATVPVGYGDGLQRAARGRARMLVRGRAVPIAGRVLMDAVMLDVTGVPDVSEGDEVVLIGSQAGAILTADDLAAACSTNAYEVVTNVRARVPRRYLKKGRVVATKTLLDGYRRC